MKALACACCGIRTLGQQWWNRDTGYGLCSGCVPFILERETMDELKQSYGEPGVHFAMPLTLECVPGMLVAWKNVGDAYHRVGKLKEWDNGTAIVHEYRSFFSGDENGEVAVRVT